MYGLADDLDQRRAGAIDVDRATVAGVHVLAGVFLEMDAHKLDELTARPASDRHLRSRVGRIA